MAAPESEYQKLQDFLEQKVVEYKKAGGDPKRALALLGGQAGYAYQPDTDPEDAALLILNDLTELEQAEHLQERLEEDPDLLQMNLWAILLELGPSNGMD